MPIVTFNNLSLAFGTDQILDKAEQSIEAGERIAVTGRNGAGKSTLLGLISGDVTEDDGNIWRADNQKFVTLAQDLPERTDQSVFDAVSSVFKNIGETLSQYHDLTHHMAGSDAENKQLAKLQAALDHADGWNISHRIEATLDRLNLDADAPLNTLSGGWLKRVAIAQSLVQDPDVWILDEPTNHLDLDGIQWLESLLLEFPGTVLFVSHDRQLMQSVATSVLEIAHGNLTRYNCDYTHFIDRRDKAREVEAEHNKQFDDKLKAEETWIRQGIKARRTRNEGRVRALEALREERSQRVSLKGLKLQVDSGRSSGKIVKEVTSVNKAIDGKPIIKDLDLIIQRGDRIGLLGPNGCGKSTLLKLLLDEIKPDSGKIKTGTKLQTAYFDQAREQLDQNQSVHEYIAEGRDFISVNGKDLHVVSYLQNFLFNPDQSRSPIRTLSGGEQNRLLLAKLFTLPTNLLVLDEPTNDLDIETLELLEELLIEYKGTVLLVSHDRTFMDNVVSSLLVFEGGGKVQEYVGGYADWTTQAKTTSASTTDKPKQKIESTDHETRKKQKAEIQKRQRDLDKITGQIEKMEQQLEKLNSRMAETSFFDLSPEKQTETYDKASTTEAQLDELMTQWELLESESNKSG
ncbi:MAG: ATP-binding cassette domain-containing protein [Gammaproteobacteria bacterium]|jgi:ABC transport system ATP-binding/permease protein|nr:ATP-binding cassette domain-containing protein [Gammaproteobacteria bacterium]MBT4494762.1 ATP-binding cassette domain-containing protein [Gammaproteobacteria bacterium]MBT7371124.1 ATP-binding cassette domain-containing protein [Gammaproteobacteria bacterium]